jgi:hypothetical protein
VFAVELVAGSIQNDVGSAAQVGSVAFRCGDCLQVYQGVTMERLWQVRIAGEHNLGPRHTSLRVANLDVDMRRGDNTS